MGSPPPGRSKMTSESLAQAIARAGGAVELLRNQNWPAFTFPVAPGVHELARRAAGLEHHRRAHGPVAPHDAALPRRHRPDPAARAISPNTFATFRRRQAKQLISVNQDGYLIGDGILFYNSEEREGLALVGHHLLIDWVRFNAREGRSRGQGRPPPSSRPTRTCARGRRRSTGTSCRVPPRTRSWRRSSAGPLPDVKFFHIADVQHRRPRRSTACGTAWRVSPASSSSARGTTTRPSWTPCSRPVRSSASGGSAPRPTRRATSSRAGSRRRSRAIFDEHLGRVPRVAAASRMSAPSAGRLFSDDIHDYYMTPYDLGSAGRSRFDHDFHRPRGARASRREPPSPQGHAALERRRRRRRRQLAGRAGLPAKFLDFPKARYGLYQMDTVLHGRQAGRHLDGRGLCRLRPALHVARDSRRRHPRRSRRRGRLGRGPDLAEALRRRRPPSGRIRATVAPAPFHDWARTVYRAND